MSGQRGGDSLMPGLLVWGSIFVVISVMELCGCGHVARRADTFALEGWAAVLRQHEAAEQLVEVAEELRVAGDVTRCVEVLSPALEIEARAWAAWARGQWLAGLAYHDQAGELPEDGTQPDPGPPPAARSALQLCQGEERIEYSRRPRDRLRPTLGWHRA